MSGQIFRYYHTSFINNGMNRLVNFITNLSLYYFCMTLFFLAAKIVFEYVLALTVITSVLGDSSKFCSALIFVFEYVGFNRHYRKPKTSPPDPLSLTGEREIFCLFRRGVKHNNGIILPLSC
ncbi:hypothetical protein CCP3SC1_730001 [Gammaproteobacteria bacterium]